ncbi:MAG: polymorphic toxin type 37 domain-containing protein [Oscillospiraceae bacterium]|nr:polymorphic toxin type 37 domain-containing protein [Oscillospiraceae bacterium]
MLFKKGCDIINEVCSEYWKIWISEQDFKTCVACRNLDGKIFGITDRIPEPPIHLNCRCRTEAVQVVLKKDADYYIDTIVASGNTVYDNASGKLPGAPWRIWYEADTRNIDGNKVTERILYSSDGWIFVTRNHYRTFIEIGRSDDVMSEKYEGIELKYPGNAPSKSPGEGFEWKGSGDPNSGRGNWYNPQTGEKWNPDIDHNAPIGPHWDYTDKDGNSFRVFPDGRIEPK